MNDPLLHPGEVADMFGVDRKTLVRWANLPPEHKAHVPSIKTRGGHRRYRKSVILLLLAENN